MRRLLLAGFVVAVDIALTARGLPPWALACYAAAVTAVVTAGVATAGTVATKGGAPNGGVALGIRERWPLVAFVAALCLAALTGQSYVLLLWASYQAGSAVVGAAGTAVLTG